MKRSPRAWIGKWLAAVGALHFAAGFLIYSTAWTEIFSNGAVASVDDHSRSATAFWFAALGPAVMMFGALVDWVERSGQALPRWLGPALALFSIALILPMPVTGAWLLLPPSIALILRSRRRSG